MNKFNKVLAVAVLAAMSTACSKVPAGNVGVKAYLLGGNKGVDTEILTPGRYWIGINEELYLFPTFTQNYTWTKSPHEGRPVDESLSFQTVEGLSVNADLGISYSFNPEKISAIFQKYRKGVDEITDIYLRNMVRDALVTAGSTRPIETVYGKGKGDLIVEVEKIVRDQVGPLGINVEKIYWIGDLRLPANVVNALNAKIAATQMAQQRENEVAQAKAEADKQVAVARGEADSTLLKAKAQAEANELLERSLTPALVQYRAIEQWDGKLPSVNGGAMPFINVAGAQRSDAQK